MKIAGLVKSSCIDFPGKLSAVVFTPGCNYDCWYCQNRQLLGHPVPLLDEDAVASFLRRRVGLLEGVAVSGGEPTLQEDLCSFLRFVKGLGYAVKLDTNGSRPDTIATILEEGLADYIALDYKAPWADYPSLCGRGVRPEPVQETIRLLLDSAIEWEARTTVYPGLTGGGLRTMAAEAPVLPRYILQRCRAEDGAGQSGYSATELRELAAELKTVQPHICARVG